MAQVDVWTQHNDNARSGANLDETELNTTTVNVNTFGKLWSFMVDGDIYTQPLVIQNVNIPGQGVHNVVYVATMNNSVYAFDADDNQGANGQPLWHVSFINPAAGITPVPAAEVVNSNNIRNPGPIGVMGTPVVDRGTGTMYLVARTKENGSYVQRLHALDIRNGSEKFGGPALIQASVAGSGNDKINGQIVFNPKTQNQRPGLALANGNVYIAWASHDDIPPYHGWVIAYGATSLAQTGAFCVSPDGTMAGVWQDGQAPSVDAAGNVYVMTANGDFNGVRNFGESIVKLNSSLSAVLDWFAPDNWSTLNFGDTDLGSAGVLLIPGTNRVVGGGKSGLFFVLDTGNMGHVQTGNGQIVQNFQVTTGGHIHGSPVFWSGPNGPMTYVWGEHDALKAFAYNGSTFTTTPATQSSFLAPNGMPGGFLSVSANGAAAGSGIVWGSLPFAADAENAVVSGILRAFDASDLTHEIWNSRLIAARDDVGNFAKTVPPTVANGRVYMASFSNYLHVYGLLDSIPPGGGGQLSLSGVASTAAVDLTAVGTVDWAHWSGYDHKASGNGQISNVTSLGTTAFNYNDDPRTFSWSDGTPTVTGASLHSGIYTNGVGAGFLVTVPADTTTRTLNIYAGGWSSRGAIYAHLSDGSAPDVTDTAFSGGGHYGAVYTLTYHAASANQTLTVQWTQFSGGGNVEFQAAALTGGGGGPGQAAPTGVNASDGTSATNVTIGWNAANGATSYSIYRSTVLGTQGSLLGPTASTSFTDSTPTPGTTYYYGVTATGAGGTSSLSAQDSGYAALAPAPPTGVTASDGTSTTSVTVTWNASANATSYTLYRSTVPGTQGPAIGGASALTLTDTSAVPGTTYYYGVTATGPGGTSALSAQDSGYASVAGVGGALSGSVATSTVAVNETATGIADWAHWPGYDHKATGGGQISNVTAVGTGMSSYANDPRTLSWSDGTPTASGSSASGLYITGAGKGFSITAPADTTTRTLKVYVGGWSSSGKLMAHLSDGSAVDYVDATPTGGGQYDAVYTLVYSAASAGKLLTVQWLQLAGYGNVTLQGAVLIGGGVVAPAPPTGVSASDGTSGNSVTISWNASNGATSYSVYRSTTAGTQGTLLGPATSTSFNDSTPTPGTTYYYGVTATGAGGTSALSAQDSGYAALPPAAPTGVSASDGTSTTSVSISWNAVVNAQGYTVYRSPTAGTQGSSLGPATGTIYTDTSAVPGTTYYYGVKATGAGGTSALSAQDSGYAALTGSGGTLSGSVLASAAAANLTTTGTADWAHWPGYDHKATGASQISNVTAVGAGMSSYGNDPRALSWSDGTPNGSGSSTGGIYITGAGTGFSFTVPADATTRTLKVYVGGWSSSGKLVAHLSDGSAVDYVDATPTGSGQYDAVYTLTYSAGSAGKLLTVQWLEVAGYGNVALQGVALIAGGAVAPAPPTGVSASDGTSGNSVTISWNASNGATSYSVYRSTTAGTQGTLLGPATLTSFNDSTPTPGTTYYYGVTATGAGGTSALSAQDSGYAALPPAAPTGVSASDGTSGNSVTITWNASNGATSYSVYRSTTAGTQGALQGPATLTSFTDSTVTPGTTYYYGVTATGTGGTSALSAQDSGYAAAGGSGGTLSGSVATSTVAVNLTTTGTADWAHWPGYDHKATGGSQISNVTAVGAGMSSYGNDPRALSWSDGTPNLGGSSTNGLYITGAGKGFSVTVPADMTTRTLKVYVGGWSSSGKLVAHLSDSSAADYVDATLSGGGQYDAVYTLTYSAGSAGKLLTVQWLEVAGYGNVTFQGAALK